MSSGGPLTGSPATSQVVSDYVDVTDYGAVGDTVTLTDGAITSGTKAFTSSSAVFTALDVGKTIIIAGAGSASADLVSTIAAFVSATAVTLADNAGSTVSGKTVYYGWDDTAAIVAALAIADTASGVNRLFFPPGGYILARGQFTSKYTEVYGVRDRTTIFAKAGSTSTLLTFTTQNGSPANSHARVLGLGSCVHDFNVIDTATVNPTTGMAMLLNDVAYQQQRPLVYNLKFIGFYQQLKFDGFSLGSIKNCHFYEFRDAGILFDNYGTDVDNGDTFVQNCTFGGHGSYISGYSAICASVRIQGCSGMYVHDNKFLTCNGAAVMFYANSTTTTSPAGGWQMGLVSNNFFDCAGEKNVYVFSGYGKGTTGITANVRNVIKNLIVSGNTFGGGQCKIDGGDGGIADVFITSNIGLDTQIYAPSYVDGCRIEALYARNLSGAYTKLILADAFGSGVNNMTTPSYADNGYSVASTVLPPFYYDYFNRKMQVGDLDGSPASQFEIRTSGVTQASLSLKVGGAAGRTYVMQNIGTGNGNYGTYGLALMTYSMVTADSTDVKLGWIELPSGNLLDTNIPTSNAGLATGAMYTTAGAVLIKA